MAQGFVRGSFPSPDYYEKLGRLQGALRDSEKKRLELERKLYEYSQSNIYRTKMKYIKLKKYLKEICESERKAHIRNQEYLKQCHQIQDHIGSFTRNSDRLEKLKMEYKTQIKKMHLSIKNNLGVKDIHQDNDEKVPQVVKPVGINPGTVMSRGLYHPATIFMGRQMSAISSTGDFSTQWKSSQPTKSFSISDPHSCQQTAERSNVTDSCGVQMNSDTQCLNKSDKIDGKTSLQIGEKMPITSTALSELEQTHCLKIVSGANNDHEDLKHQSSINHMQEHEEESLNSSSDLTVSVSGDDLIIHTTEVYPNLSDSSDEIDETDALKLICTKQEKDALSAEKNNCTLQTVSSRASEKESSANSPTRENYLTFKGFTYLLQFIENKLAQESLHSVELYQNVIIDQERINLLISLCNQTDILKEEDLEACGAVVLHQLQRLLQHTSTKCLLPEEALIDRGSGVDEKPVSSEELFNSGTLRDQLLKHVSALKKHNISLKEEVTKMFEVFLADNSDQSSTATALLKKALTEECEDRSSIHSNESSCSLPSILNDNSEIKQAKHVQWLDSIGTRKQEVTSTCEDESKEESLIEKIPITETKAYQLLKQSTLQDNKNQTEEHYQKEKKGAVSKLELAGLNIGSSTLKTKTSNEIDSEASFSSSEGSPLSRDESKRKMTTNLKSKAFWGESDDSNSEIEAALRPRNHNTSIDDFDDFYD
ncbi:centrosomal protein kizuna isoform X1 [Antechinus flavipes]|uniref:centrosomal protein kizuna isoform X1 n=1 Tax=Antechinus flavipes TaxID=38775 RepID=UPI002236AF46|nr:centrosomal protein kizuna isoform X1 [Antechinus flavipes]